MERLLHSVCYAAAFCNPEQIYRQSVMSSTFIKYFKFKEVNKRGKEAQIIYSPVYASCIDFNHCFYDCAYGCLLYTSAEAFRPVQSDSQTSEWYSYFENDVLELRSGLWIA